MEKINFYEQIERNKRYSWILMVLVFATVAVLSVAFAIIIAGMYDIGTMFIFLIFATVFNIGYILATYYKSADIAVSSVGAIPADAPQYKQLNNIVEEMAIASGQPKPKVYVMATKDINAFAAGRDPEHSIICVTEGCLQKLERQELQSVVAHEMTHIRNFDIRFVTLVAVMVGLVSILSQMFLRSMWYGGGGRNRGRGGGGGLFIVLVLAGLILSIIAPLIVKLVQLAISRKREYMADAGAVELTRYPQGMIEALKKIGEDYASPGEHTKVNAAVAPMFLADTSKTRFIGLLETHPPIKDRIKALEKML
ncbi:MAG: M48 family metallopeptidase [Candidatus Altiarchaeota archaeon]